MPRVHRLDESAREAMIPTLSKELASRVDVSFGFVYGSFLQADGFRDIDVAIWTTDRADRAVDLALASALSRTIGLPVDVRRLNDAPLSFLFHVLRGRLLLVRDELALATLIERTSRAYHDIAPLLRRATRDAFAA
jgi:uncharacterized protein